MWKSQVGQYGENVRMFDKDVKTFEQADDMQIYAVCEALLETRGLWAALSLSGQYGPANRIRDLFRLYDAYQGDGVDVKTSSCSGFAGSGRD